MLQAPEITAIICTFNRAELLRLALNSLVAQTLDAGRFELMVVDNGSTDGTYALVRGEFGHLPNLRYVHQPANGISNARNAGWRSATTKYVAYLDDDAVAEVDWLARILAQFEVCAHRRWLPGWTSRSRLGVTPAGDRLPNSLLAYLSVLSWGSQPAVMSDEQWFVATNCAFPRAALAAIDGFHPASDEPRAHFDRTKRSCANGS